MKVLIFVAFVVVASSASAQTYVRPHVKNDGTYVEGHYKTRPNNTTADNYNTQGNVNPFTGQAGAVNPYQQQPVKPPQCGYTANGQYVCR